jgi:hypothetical protein
MLVVVKFERLLRHVGDERVVGIGQVGEREGHFGLLGDDWKNPRISNPAAVERRGGFRL